MDEKRAVVVTDSDNEELSAALLLELLRFKVKIPRRPTIDVIVRMLPDLISIDWSPGSIDKNVKLVELLRSTSATRHVPILLFYSDDRDLPIHVWSVERLIPLPLYIPCSPDDVIRAIRRISDDLLLPQVTSLATAVKAPTQATDTNASLTPNHDTSGGRETNTRSAHATLTSPAAIHDTWLIDRVRTVCDHLTEVVAPLRRRRAGKAAFELNDEYDVQDALHVALRSIIDDVRTEEPGPSFAGAGSIRDFWLPSIKTIVEVKRVRDVTHGRRGVADELLADKTRYRTNAGCVRLICLVFDPGRHIPNVTVLKSDLENEPGPPRIEVFVV